MRIGMTVTIALLALALAGAPLAAYAATQSSTPRGNDVSYPQCGMVLPSGQAFGIVGVNYGLANTTNPCLTSEIEWAQGSSGHSKLPRVSLYVNTADPGRHASDWPTSNTNPVSGKRVNDPYGRCGGGNSSACAWQYGWNMAALDAWERGVPSPGKYLWWLDVETINSWETSTVNNRADLEGMASYFRRIGGRVGIYSTAKQFGPLVGSVSASSPLYWLADWIPGAKTAAQAKKNCTLAPLTRGGGVTVTQRKTGLISSDLSCRG